MPHKVIRIFLRNKGNKEERKNENGRERGNEGGESDRGGRKN